MCKEPRVAKSALGKFVSEAVPLRRKEVPDFAKADTLRHTYIPDGLCSFGLNLDRRKHLTIGKPDAHRSIVNPPA